MLFAPGKGPHVQRSLSLSRLLELSTESKRVLCLVQSPLLRVQTPMGKCSAERDSALQLLGEVCLQPLRFGGDSAPSAVLPPTDTAGGPDVNIEQKVRTLSENGE